MHRPTRKHAVLVYKLEEKKERSRRSGKKARRWKRNVEKYASLVKE